jgi:hypothetical protein
METVYEKVCPACGRSALLGSKFCSGCGHQYRTVFHDQDSQGDAPSQVGDSGFRMDAPWMPFVLAVAPVVLIVFLWYFTSSSPVVQATPVPGTDSVVVTSTNIADSGALPVSGQRQSEVQDTLGKPTYINRSNVGGEASEDWYYTRGTHTLKVHFNGNNVVDNFVNY